MHVPARILRLFCLTPKTYEYRPGRPATQGELLALSRECKRQATLDRTHHTAGWNK